MNQEYLIDTITDKDNLKKVNYASPICPTALEFLWRADKWREKYKKYMSRHLWVKPLGSRCFVTAD